VTTEVAPGIHRVEAPFGERFVCLYVLVGTDRVIVVDAGADTTPRTHLRPALEALGLPIGDVTDVLITHADVDHAGGVATLRELVPTLRVIAHELERPAIEHVDVIVGDGDRVELGAGWEVRVLHTPGHAPGHISVHDARSGSLVIGDAVLGAGIGDREGRLVLPPIYRDVDAYLASIRRLEEHRAARLLTGHFVPLEGTAVAAFLAESRDFVERLELMIQRELEAARVALTVPELIARLGAQPPLADALLGHLERAAAEGRARVEDRRGVAAWRAP
jgi:glyoxylase-like metal-dependent hydrolase (beta-lactamase superfamily II)